MFSVLAWTSLPPRSTTEWITAARVLRPPGARRHIRVGVTEQGHHTVIRRVMCRRNRSRCHRIRRRLYKGRRRERHVINKVGLCGSSRSQVREERQPSQYQQAQSRHQTTVPGQPVYYVLRHLHKRTFGSEVSSFSVMLLHGAFFLHRHRGSACPPSDHCQQQLFLAQASHQPRSSAPAGFWS